MKLQVLGKLLLSPAELFLKKKDLPPKGGREKGEVDPGQSIRRGQGTIDWLGERKTNNSQKTTI